MNIRGKAIVIFKHNGKYLFTVCYEETKNEVFYIPVGGGIEFGEHSLDAARREVMEEIKQEIENVRLVSVTENIFTFNRIEEHEIVFTYAAEFKNRLAYSSVLKGGTNAEGKKIKLVWATPDEIINKNIRLYPRSLMELLKQSTV